LSYYDFPELSQYLPKDKFFWMEKEFFRSSASFSETKDTKGTELLILNYDPKTFIKYSDDDIVEYDTIEKEIIENDDKKISDDEIIEESIVPEIIEKVEKQKIEIVESKEEIKEEIKVESEDYWNS